MPTLHGAGIRAWKEVIMEISRNKESKLVIDGEKDLVLYPYRQCCILVKECDEELLITNFLYHGIKKGFFNKLKVLWYVLKYIYKS